MARAGDQPDAVRAGAGRHGLAIAILAAAWLAAPAAAQDVPVGTWRGGYVCAQGHTALALTIEPRKDGSLGALFHFEAAPGHPDVPSGCFEMVGRFDAATGRLRLAPARWLHRPADYVMVGLDGRISADRSRIEGRVEGPRCAGFAAERAPGPPAAAEACRRGAPLLSLR